MRKIGVVILNYKDSFTTIDLCRRIENFNVINKIVVVDNLSPDDSYDRLCSLKSDKVEVILSDRNGGYSYGNNLGAFHLINKWKIDTLIIANPDVEFNEKFINDCINAMNENSLACVGGVMLDASKNLCRINKKINSFFQDCLDCTIIAKRFFVKEVIDISKKINYVELVPGSLLVIDSNVFCEVNGFDDKVFLYCEERILGAKLKMKGYKSAIINCTYIHNHSVSINKSLSKINQIKQLYESRRYFYDNYVECPLFKKKLLRICMVYGIVIRKILYRILY